jgi:hypothetical protein
MRWAVYAAHVAEMRNAYGILIGRREGKMDHLENLFEDGRIILKLILNICEIVGWIHLA